MRHLRHLNQFHRLPPHFELALSQLSPNLAIIFNEDSIADATFGSDGFTILQLTDYLEDAVKLFEKSTMFELSLEAYGLLETVYRADRKYPELSSRMGRCQVLIDRMTDDKNPPGTTLSIVIAI